MMLHCATLHMYYIVYYQARKYLWFSYNIVALLSNMYMIPYAVAEHQETVHAAVGSITFLRYCVVLYDRT